MTKKIPKFRPGKALKTLVKSKPSAATMKKPPTTKSAK